MIGSDYLARLMGWQQVTGPGHPYADIHLVKMPFISIFVAAWAWACACLLIVSWKSGLLVQWQQWQTEKLAPTLPPTAQHVHHRHPMSGRSHPPVSVYNQ